MHAKETERGTARPRMCVMSTCFYSLYCCYLRENRAASARLLSHLPSPHHTCTLWAGGTRACAVSECPPCYVAD